MNEGEKEEVSGLENKKVRRELRTSFLFSNKSNDLDILQNVGVVALGDGGDDLLDVFDVDHVVFDGDALLRDLHRIRRSVLVVGVDGEDVGGCGVLLLAFGQGVIGGDEHVDGLIRGADRKSVV